MSAAYISSGQTQAPTAVITGASAGIGRELAKEFAQHGYHLVLVARRQDALQALADELAAQHKINTYVLPADLAQAHAAQSIYDYTVKNGLHIDVLVNNAAFGANAAFVKQDMTTHLDMLQVNITALVELTRLYLPAMLKANRGGVLNVASTAAFLPGPFMAVYYASKAFVLSLSEALSNEVGQSGVRICCLCPGATMTEFQERAKMKESRLFKGPAVMTAAEVARQGYAGFSAGKSVVVTGVLNQIAAFSTRLLPRATSAQLARKFQEQ